MSDLFVKRSFSETYYFATIDLSLARLSIFLSLHEFNCIYNF